MLTSPTIASSKCSPGFRKPSAVFRALGRPSEHEHGHGSSPIHGHGTFLMRDYDHGRDQWVFSAFLLFLMARGFCLYVGIAGERCYDSSLGALLMQKN